MPPKPKLNKFSGKQKAFPQSRNSLDNPGISTTTNNENNVLSQEAQQQFELELCWCIQQLQIAIKSGKLNAKQSKYFFFSLTGNRIA